jgi:UDP-GlcNAc:undecaprenyl-phosphate GlcNAc-1-phosphate transferase
LTGVADRLNFQTIGLDVNAPAMHENYHARWDRPGGPAEAFLWRLEIPLFVTGVPIGRLSVSAERDDQSIAEALEVLVKMVEMAEIRAAEASTLPAAPVKPVAAQPAVSARV